eukprot:5230994-Amphidinium_carterae.1
MKQTLHNSSFKRLPEHGVKVGRRVRCSKNASNCRKRLLLERIMFLHASVVRDVEHCSDGVQLGPCTCAMQGRIAATGEAPRETGVIIVADA